MGIFLGIGPPCYYIFQEEAIETARLGERFILEIKEIFGFNIYPPANLKVEVIRAFPKLYKGRVVYGKYDPLREMIVLFHGNFCRKTFIHEIFHSVSYFSRNPKLYEIDTSAKDLIEGLTEFLTGYMMFKKYKKCYDEWIMSNYPLCSISYENPVRLFGAIAQIFIPISDFLKIYLYNPNINWFDEYKKFLSCYGLEDFLFQKSRKKSKIPSSTFLGNIIMKTLHEKLGDQRVDEFRDLWYNAPRGVVLDYSTMKYI